MLTAREKAFPEPAWLTRVLGDPLLASLLAIGLVGAAFGLSYGWFRRAELR
jgi:hypothetical protein